MLRFKIQKREALQKFGVETPKTRRFALLADHPGLVGRVYIFSSIFG
jgi:hypothetical protein